MEINEEKSDKIFLKKLHDICNLLDEIDELIKTNSIRLSDIDQAKSDLEHTLENEELNNNEFLNISKELKRVMKVRRGIKNESEIITSYNENKQKLIFQNQREFFKNAIGIKNKNLNQPYKNRVYTVEQINELKNRNDDIKTAKKENKIELANAKAKIKIDLQELELQLVKGKTQRELAIMFGCSQPTINYWIKKIDKERNKK